MKNLTRILLTVALLSVFSFQTQSQEIVDRIVSNKEIRIGISGQQTPFSMISKSGSPIGFDIDIAKGLAESINVKPTFVQMKFADLLPALGNGELDIIISGLTMTPERNLKHFFAGPYLISGKSILTKNKRIIQSRIEDLNTGRIKISALKGSTSEAYVRKNLPNSELIPVNSYDEAVEMVINGDIDLMLADYSQCAYASFRHLDQQLLIKEDLLDVERIGIAIPAEDPLLLNLVQNYIDHLRDSEKLNKIEDKWFRNGSWLSEIE